MADIEPIAPLTVADLTTADVNGTGAFDVLMKACSKQLDREFDLNRIRGADYSQVYLGGMQAILQNAVVFLLQKDKAANESNLVLEQIKLAVLQQEMLRMEIAREELNKELISAQVAKTKAETTNTITENDNIKAQLCLLQAQYDLTMVQKLQTTAQTSLVQQKVATEKAQTIETAVDANSVIGKQKMLYQAQADGFKRDAEQKAAKVFTDTWNVRRTTDDGTVADAVNGLSDANIGRAMQALLTGIGA